MCSLFDTIWNIYWIDLSQFQWLFKTVNTFVHELINWNDTILPLKYCSYYSKSIRHDVVNIDIWFSRDKILNVGGDKMRNTIKKKSQIFRMKQNNSHHMSLQSYSSGQALICFALDVLFGSKRKLNIHIHTCNVLTPNEYKSYTITLGNCQTRSL